MCAIAGGLGADLKELSGFRDVMKGRGPDAFSTYVGADFSVCHSRLAVVGADAPETTQPFVDNGVVLLVNGFISNHCEIRASHGWPASPSDCSVILSLYLHGGVAALGELRGQFAGVLIDQRKNRAILFRDPSGITPLYYASAGERVLFASQASWLPDLANYVGVPYSPSLSGDAFGEWRSCGYSVGPKTLLEGIHSVQPGEAIEVDLKQARVHSRGMFFDWRHPATDESHLETTRRLVKQAVERNLQEDTPPFLLFSGGLDSTLVLHCAVAAGDQPRLVTLAYPDGQNEAELAHASEVADHYGCKLEIVNFAMPSQAELQKLFSERVDWPLDGGSLLPKLAMADYCRSKGAVIVLGGSGADELFGGYRRHAARLGLYREGILLDRTTEQDYFREWIGKHDANALGPYQCFVDSISHSEFADPGFIYDLCELSQLHNPRLDSCFANIGLEYRPVFQDQDLVRFAASLPLDTKMGRNTTKGLLRDAFADEIPAHFLAVPKTPLRFSQMGPSLKWRERVMSAWLYSRALTPEMA
jgi:asparagine synthase (glutamine-hydrolysing)